MNIRIWQWGGQSTQKMRMSEMGVREEMLFSFKSMIGRLNTIFPRIYCQEFTSQTPNFKKKKRKGFPGGSVVKNPPANARDTGLIPDLGRSPMLWSNKACAPQPLSLCSRTWEPQLLSPCALYSLCSTTKEATAVRSLCTTVRE